MRVALVTPEFPGCGEYFGVGSYLATQAAALREQGAEVLVLGVTADGCFAIGADGQPRRDGAVRGPALARPLLASPWLRRRLREWDPQVVEYANWGGLGVLDHGRWLSAVRLSTPARAIRPEDRLRGLARYIHHAWEQATVRRAQLVIANSRSMSLLAGRIYGRSADHVIPHAFAGEIRTPVLGGGEVLYVGRLEHRKGTDVLLAAWTLVRVRHPAAHLHLVGADRDGFGAAALKRWGKAAISVHGRLDDRELAMIRGRCCIQVIPSRYESFGLVALEAWGGGQAVVASDNGGLGEVVDDGGLLVPPERVALLAEALLRLLRQPALGGELCRRGQQRLRTFYQPAVCARATLAAYARARGDGGTTL